MRNLIVFITLLGFMGCATISKTVSNIESSLRTPNRTYTSNPPIPTAETEIFKASIKIICDENVYKWCDGFVLKIENLSNQDIEIDWNKTLFIGAGQTYGNFMFPGILYMQRNAPRSPGIILANSIFTQNIRPTALVKYDKSLGWYHRGIPVGENHGVYLTLKIDGKEIHEKLMFDLAEQEI